ncbi:MAG: hypothetical protein K0U24_03465 [Gammaproteobacteria bacterium]|nr:hypothetical protein [Gammaproteobacteria bacterium]MCH9763274.1 hypothetical protein [Gammaproteobacteria bacterium]
MRIFSPCRSRGEHYEKSRALNNLIFKLKEIEPACFEGSGLFQKPGHEKLMNLSEATHKLLSVADKFENLSGVARSLYIGAFQNIGSLSSYIVI